MRPAVLVDTATSPPCNRVFMFVQDEHAAATAPWWAATSVGTGKRLPTGPTATTRRAAALALPALKALAIADPRHSAEPL